MPVSKSLVVSAEQSPPVPDLDAGRLERGVLGGSGAVGAAARLDWACLRALRRPRLDLPLTFAQIWEIGIGSLPLVLLVAIISGAVTSEQTGHQYSSTFAPWVVGSVITASVLTELGPLSTGLVLVGRVGARIGAELAAMAVTDQIQPGTSSATLARGDTLAAFSTPTLAETFTEVGARASEAFARASDLLSPDRVAEVERGARSLSRLVDELTALTVTLRATVARLQRRLDDARLDSATSDVAYTALSLGGTSGQLRVASTSLASILAKLDQGHGTLGRALNDSSLYEALLTAATHANEAATGASDLVRDVRARPERYVRVSLF